MRKPGDARPHKRDGVWYLIRRVPKEFVELDKRTIVKVSTEISVVDDPRAIRAKAVVRQLSLELEAYWRGLRDGQSVEARRRYDAAQKRAKVLGLTYRTALEQAEGSVDEIVRRVQLLLDRKAVDDEGEVTAVLGGEDRPKLLLSNLVDEYKEVNRTGLKQKSPNQVRKWENPKKLALNNFIDLNGDMFLDEITRMHTLRFRSWWSDRVMDEGIQVGTANKNIGSISAMYKAVTKAHQLEVKPVFSELRLAGQIDNQRPPFPTKFIQDVILAAGTLDELNEDARDLVMIVADTGMRLSEAANLRQQTIFLDAVVPYVKVLPIERQLKVVHTARDIPLVGCALDAMNRHPEGFPRYQDKADSLSALVNKYFDNHGLLPTPDHSFYSLRHSFEDRLTDIEAPEKVIAALMGHKWIRPKYGAGPTLEQKQRWMGKIAFMPPKHG